MKGTLSLCFFPQPLTWARFMIFCRELLSGLCFGCFSSWLWMAYVRFLGCQAVWALSLAGGVALSL